ncbi:MAG: sigma-70 family RNA polymerase sigma factor [Planctomycetota bacterium]|jgi:RNA polymerase sigma-70 factor (ECF subfamily)
MDSRRLEELVRRAQAGNKEAAAELVRSFEGPVRAAIRRRLGTDLRRRVDTDDIFQSTILASLDELSGFRYQGEKEFVAWLAAVAERRIVTAARRHRAAKRDVRREHPALEANGIAGDRTSPTQGAVRAEVTEDIQRAVDRLPALERRAVELHAYEGLGFGELARRLGLTDKHAARRLFQRALKRMGDLIESEGI